MKTLFLVLTIVMFSTSAWAFPQPEITTSESACGMPPHKCSGWLFTYRYTAPRTRVIVEDDPNGIRGKNHRMQTKSEAVDYGEFVSNEEAKTVNDAKKIADQRAKDHGVK